MGQDYSGAYPFETGPEGASSCACHSRSERQERRHLLSGTVRVRTFDALQRAIAGQRAAPYFVVAATVPAGEEFELVRELSGGVVPVFLLNEDIRRESHVDAGEGEPPPLVLLAPQPKGKKMRRQGLATTRVLVATGERLAIRGRKLRSPWARAQVFLAARCQLCVLERLGESRIRVDQANLCSLPVKARGIRTLHFGYRSQPGEDAPPPPPLPPPPRQPESSVEEDELVDRILLQLFDRLAPTLLPRPWGERYRNARGSEQKLEELRAFARARGGLDLGG